MEPTYTVMLSIPYEGLCDIFSGTEDQIIEWLKNCGYHLDDMELYSNEPVPDIYSLAQRAGR